jgi:hypothetical protein
MMTTFRPVMMVIVLAASLTALSASSAQERLVVHSPDIHVAGPPRRIRVKVHVADF